MGETAGVFAKLGWGIGAGVTAFGLCRRLSAILVVSLSLYLCLQIKIRLLHIAYLKVDVLQEINSQIYFF
jgi:hypothetical protein